MTLMTIQPTLMVLMVATTLAGCVTMSEPVPVGRDTYMMSIGARGGLSGSNSELVVQAVQKAGVFCESTGREIELRNTSSSGVQGWTPQSGQVIFACLAASDPRYVEPKYSPSANFIVEHRVTSP
jgi:predicted small secreted protein